MLSSDPRGGDGYDCWVLGRQGVETRRREGFWLPCLRRQPVGRAATQGRDVGPASRLTRAKQPPLDSLSTRWPGNGMTQGGPRRANGYAGRLCQFSAASQSAASAVLISHARENRIGRAPSAKKSTSRCAPHLHHRSCVPPDCRHGDDAGSEPQQVRHPRLRRWLRVRRAARGGHGEPHSQGHAGSEE